MRTIDIDFDIHKLIELERRGFEESPNTVLRRLLGLAAQSQPEAAAESGVGGWRDRDGLMLPNGTQVRMTYNGRLHEGAIERGVWVAEGSQYGTPSGAAEGVARTKTGKPAKLNGWMYWEAKLPGTQEWTSILTLSDAQKAAR